MACSKASLFFIPAALVAKNSITAAQAGFIAAAGAVLFVAVIPLAGRALDKSAAASAVVDRPRHRPCFRVQHSHIVLATISVALAGVGFGSLLGAPTRYIVSSEAPGEMRASADRITQHLPDHGNIVGGSVAGGIVGLYKLEGFRDAYLASAFVGVIVAAGTRFLKSREDERASAQPTAA